MKKKQEQDYDFDVTKSFELLKNKESDDSAVVYSRKQQLSGLKNKESKKFILKLAAGGAMVLGSMGALGYLVNKLGTAILTRPVDNSNFEKYKDDFYQVNGNVVRLPIGNEPIAVVLNDMNVKQKEQVVQAVNALDEISKNINYTLYDGMDDYDNDNGLNYISISLVDDIEEQEGAGGVAKLRYNKFTAEIIYPIEIEIESQWSDAYWDKEETKSLLTTITKHELMHTLGFKDLYDENDKQRSIMYYATQSDTQQSYTQEDIEKIQYCYDGMIATTSKPQNMEINQVDNFYFERKDNEKSM